jgi:hypothetical protein
MPELIDYSARFDRIREAVFMITLRDGPDAINLPAVARELDMSVSSLRRLLSTSEHLPRLGFQWIERMRRRRVSQRVPGEVDGQEVWKRALNLLLRELPSDTDRVDEARVWASLVTAHEGAHPWAQQARTERDRWLEDLSGRVFADTVPAGDELRYESARLRALVEGLTAGVCRGWLDHDEVVNVVR